MTQPEPPKPQSTEVAFLQLMSSLQLLEASVTGKLDLILQRLDQLDQRSEDHAQQLRDQDGRLDALERDTVTRADLKQVVDQFADLKGQAVTKDDLEKRQTASARTITIAVSVLAILVGAGTSILTSVLT